MKLYETLPILANGFRKSGHKNFIILYEITAHAKILHMYYHTKGISSSISNCTIYHMSTKQIPMCKKGILEATYVHS